MRRIIRQWTAVRWAAVAAAAAAMSLAVTGCGQTQLGAAAFYSGHRISSATLAAEVANLNAGYQADKAKVQIAYKPTDMPREVLSWILRFATVEQVATGQGITVTRAQAQAQLAQEVIRARQAGDSLAEVAVLNGLPPDMLPELGRWFAIQAKLADKLDHGVAPTTTAAANALSLQINHVQCLAAKSMSIKVNPQYGAYDYSQLIVVPATSELSAVPLVGKVAPSPSATPQLTPKC